MIDFWRKTSIDNYIEKLYEFYNNCTSNTFRSASTVDNLNQEEKIYLNENIQLDKIIGCEKKYILNQLLSDYAKFNFAVHVLVSINIELDVHQVDETNKTVFELLVDSAIYNKEYYFYKQMMFLYKRGYKNQQQDEKYLIEFYKTKIINQQMMELWCLTRVCYKLNNYEKIEKAFFNIKIILTLLSFKQGKPVGFNYPNLLGIANNAIQHYREYGEIILYGMRYYNVYGDIRKRDKKKTFKEKEEDFLKFKPIQDVEFNEIIYEIFSDLKH